MYFKRTRCFHVSHNEKRYKAISWLILIGGGSHPPVASPTSHPRTAVGRGSKFSHSIFCFISQNINIFQQKIVWSEDEKERLFLPGFPTQRPAHTMVRGGKFLPLDIFLFLKILISVSPCSDLQPSTQRPAHARGKIPPAHRDRSAH